MFATLSEAFTHPVYAGGDEFFQIGPFFCFFLLLCAVFFFSVFFFFFQAEDGIRDLIVTGVQTCALPISALLATRGLFSIDEPGARLLGAAAACALAMAAVSASVRWTGTAIVFAALPGEIGRASCRERV